MIQKQFFISLICLIILGCTTQKKQNYKETINIKDPGSTLPDNWWKKAVFYECFVRSFKDSDGDGNGDLKGLISKLDYLNELGITGIWLMPVMESLYSEGYTTVDYRDIEDDYGNLDDFKKLLDEAHKRGIAIIIDFVINHSAYNHPFFLDTIKDKKSIYRDWYIWEDNIPESIIKIDYIFRDNPWYKSDTGYYYAFFWNQMPDWNYKNENVKAYMNDNIKFWLNIGVDGYRFDAVSYLIENGKYNANYKHQSESHVYYQNIRKIIDQYDNRFIISEAGANPFEFETEIFDYIQDSPKEFHSTFAFYFQRTIIESVLRENPAQLDSEIKNIIMKAPEGTMFSIFLSNHDYIFGLRAINQLKNDPTKCKLAASILLTIPGIPFIYYGEEIGMSTNSDLDKWSCVRTPMQWTSENNAGFTTGIPYRKINPNYKKNNVNNEKKDPDSLLNHYKKIIRIRKSYSALSTGSYEKISTNNDKKYFAFLRRDSKNNIIIILNFSDKTENITLDFSTTTLENYNMKAEKDLYNNKISYQNLSLSNYNKYIIKNVDAYGIRIISLLKLKR